jgi:hypothetical protein
MGSFEKLVIVMVSWIVLGVGALLVLGLGASDVWIIM